MHIMIIWAAENRNWNVTNVKGEKNLQKCPIKPKKNYET